MVRGKGPGAGSRTLAASAPSHQGGVMVMSRFGRGGGGAMFGRISEMYVLVSSEEKSSVIFRRWKIVG